MADGDRLAGETPAKVPNRPTALGRDIGRELARLIQPDIDKWVAAGVPDDRCASCAFRHGTVPNGCEETVMDAIKALMEGDAFFCHMKQPVPSILCHGWHAGRDGMIGKKTIMPWDYSNQEARDAEDMIGASPRQRADAASAASHAPRVPPKED